MYFLSMLGHVYMIRVNRKRNGNVRKFPFRHVHQMKTQLSLRIFAIWTEFVLSACCDFAPLAIQNALGEDSDQTARMRSLIWIFAERICPKVRFLTLRLKMSLRGMRTANAKISLRIPRRPIWALAAVSKHHCQLQNVSLRSQCAPAHDVLHLRTSYY